MPKRWSKLRKRVKAIVDPKLSLDIHCVLYRHYGFVGLEVIPRYFVTLNKEIIFDWPKDFPWKEFENKPAPLRETRYDTAASGISNTIAAYLNADIPTRQVMTDPWGIVEILRAADKRTGRRQWKKLFHQSGKAARKIITARWVEQRKKLLPKN